LTDGQIVALVAGDQTALEHIESCTACRERVARWREAQAAIAGVRASGGVEAAGDCPGIEDLANYAGGGQDRGYEEITRHLASCDRCAAIVREGLEGMEAEEARSTPLLKSSGKRWQRAAIQSAWLRRYGAAAAALIAVGGAAWWWSSRSSDVPVLLAKAYTEARPFEYRLPDAGYGKVRQTRGNESAFGHPEEMEAAMAALRKRLADRPRDRRELALKGRAELLAGNYDAAIESLEQAAPGDQGPAEVLADLGVAYAGRGDAEKRPRDYGHAADLMLRALAAKPHDQRLEFNIALTYEKLRLVNEAIAAWQKFLSENPPDGWRREAVDHLSALEKMRAEKKAADDQTMRDPARFLEAHGTADFDPLPWFEIFWTDWMPKAASEPAAARAAELVARGFARFGEDALIESVKAPASERKAKGLALLSEAMKANRGGRAGAGLEPARAAAGLLDRAGLQGAAALARIEQVYATGWTGAERECMETAGRLVDSLGARNRWLEGSAHLEHSSCLQWDGQDGPARNEIEATRKGLAAAGLWPLELRAMQFTAGSDAYSGNYSPIWDTAAEGLQRYWSSPAPAIRAQAFQVFMELAADAAGWNDCAVVLYRAAANSAHAAGNIEIEAANHAGLAQLLDRMGNSQDGSAEWDAARNLLGRAGDGEDVKVLRWETELWRVESEMASKTTRDPMPALERLDSQAGGQRAADRSELKQTLGTALGARGDRSGAASAFGDALEMNRKLADSEKSWVRRFPIVELAALSYRNLAEIDFAAGRDAEARKIWREFRPSAAGGERRITLALLPAGIAVWSGSAGKLRWVESAAEEWRKAASELVAMCASPDSSEAEIRRVGNRLYRALVEPELRGLGPGRVWLDTDGWLAQIPFGALTDDAGHYLARDFEFVEAYGPPRKAPAVRVTAQSTALIVAAFNGIAPGGAKLPALASAAREAEEVAARFAGPHVTRDATAASLVADAPKAQVFHFCGHGWANGGNGALILPPGAGGDSEFVTARNLAEEDWSQCQLAVLSACLTATGETRGAVNNQSLVQALLSAGARSVVAARWSIDSEATRALMNGFYGRLLSGTSVPESLYGAAREVAAAPGWGHPYYWAGFDIFGSA
jgi:tetratricopeptide (TPR) repeat protein